MNRKRNRRILYYSRKPKSIKTILDGSSTWRWAIRYKHFNFREWFWFYKYPIPSVGAIDMVELGIRHFRNDGYRTIHTMAHVPANIRNESHYNKKLSNFK